MKVYINNQEATFDHENISLQEVLLSIDISQAQGLAVAINNKIVSKDLWDNSPIQENDKITVIRATQGG